MPVYPATASTVNRIERTGVLSVKWGGTAVICPQKKGIDGLPFYFI